MISGIQIVGIVRGNSTARARIVNRFSHTFIYKISGESIYYLRGDEVHLSAGAILYIPEGESYSFEKISKGESIYCLINFHSSTPFMEKPKLFSPQNDEHLDYVFNQMQKHWHFSHIDSDSYELLSLFYHLISILSDGQNHLYYTSSQGARLAPAIEYLEQHLYCHDLTVSKLSNICGISEVTFRKLFFAKFGESPKKYIIRCRLIKAKNIIESGEYSSINKVSDTVGYKDALYFSKHFKSYFGYSPTKI